MASCLQQLSEVNGVYSRRRHDALQNLFSRIGELVTLPESVLEILRLTSDEEADVDALVQAILRDPAMSARILRQVNSSYYGLRTQVENIPNAVTLLGLREIRRLAQTFHCRRLFDLPGNYRSYSRRGLWRHSVVVAHFSRAVAREVGLPNFDDCYLAGLLHDLGLILMDQSMRRPFCQILDLIDEGREPLEAERRVLSFDHTHLGACVAEGWRLPPTVVAAIEFHHTPAHAPDPFFHAVATVAFGNYLASTQNITSLGVEYSVYPGDALLARLGLNTQHWHALIEKLPDVLEEAEGISK